MSNTIIKISERNQFNPERIFTALCSCRYKTRVYADTKGPLAKLYPEGMTIGTGSVVQPMENNTAWSCWNCGTTYTVGEAKQA